MAEKGVSHEDQIDLIELSKVIWSRRWFIAKVSGILMLLGLLVALTSNVEYQATCTLMPENQESGNNIGGLSSLAGLAGINLGMGASTGSITPKIYPEIVMSSPFQLSLLHEPIFFKDKDTTMSSYQYFMTYPQVSLVGFIKGYTIGLPGKIIGLFKKSPADSSIRATNETEIFSLSSEDWKILEKYKQRFDISSEKRMGIITLSVEMPDAYASAQLVNLLVKKLTSEVSGYKTKKAELNLRFIEQRYQEAQVEYEVKQRAVALFTDQNRNMTSSMAKVEYQRLQNDLSIAFEVYKGLAAQREQARIKVKEETPVFTVLEPVTVPIYKSSPRKALILMISISLGLFIGCGWVLFWEIYTKLNR